MKKNNDDDDKPFLLFNDLEVNKFYCYDGDEEIDIYQKVWLPNEPEESCPVINNSLFRGTTFLVLSDPIYDVSNSVDKNRSTKERLILTKFGIGYLNQYYSTGYTEVKE